MENNQKIQEKKNIFKIFGWSLLTAICVMVWSSPVPLILFGFHQITNMVLFIGLLMCYAILLFLFTFFSEHQEKSKYLFKILWNPASFVLFCLASRKEG
jgi:hypothetical protein